MDVGEDDISIKDNNGIVDKVGIHSTTKDVESSNDELGLTVAMSFGSDHGVCVKLVPEDVESWNDWSGSTMGIVLQAWYEVDHWKHGVDKGFWHLEI